MIIEAGGIKILCNKLVGSISVALLIGIHIIRIVNRIDSVSTCIVEDVGVSVYVIPAADIEVFTLEGKLAFYTVHCT